MTNHQRGFTGHCQVDGLGCSIAARWCEPAWVRGCHTVAVQGSPVPGGDHQPLLWLYYRFPLSLRDVREMMAERGVIVSYESIHQWCRKFGRTFANQLRRRRARSRAKWQLDEVFVEV